MRNSNIFLTFILFQPIFCDTTSKILCFDAKNFIQDGIHDDNFQDEKYSGCIEGKHNVAKNNNGCTYLCTYAYGKQIRRLDLSSFW